jgi:PIN domain nuclease of toxin-antitoxin system
LSGERGGERLADFLDEAFISVITYTEIVTKLMDGGAPFAAATQSVAALDVPTIDVTEPLARRAAELRATTRSQGLSLGDRVCLSTAESIGATAVTADRAWANLNIGISIQLIR